MDAASMFIRYFVILPQSGDVVAEALVRDPRAWVPGIAVGAEERGERLLAEVGFGPRRRRLGSLVEIEIGEPVRLGPTTVLPISWSPTSSTGLLPVLEGDLEVSPLGADRTQLAMSARYRPPLGGVGRVVDRALLHRVAESTVKDFLDRVALALERSIREVSTAQ